MILIDDLCDKTVTLYRNQKGTVMRQVIQHAHLQCTYRQLAKNYGEEQEKTFLLVLPAGEGTLQPGDRIWNGVGPEVADWETFLPAAYPELMELSFVIPRYWNGTLSHWEAGHK